jgi:hypothetical protein
MSNNPFLTWLTEAGRAVARAAGFAELVRAFTGWAAIAASPADRTSARTMRAHRVHAHVDSARAILGRVRAALPAAGSFYHLTPGEWGDATIGDLPSWERGGPMWGAAWIATADAMASADPLAYDALTLVYPHETYGRGDHARGQDLAELVCGVIRIAAYRAGVAALAGVAEPWDIAISGTWKPSFSAAAAAEVTRLMAALPPLPVVTDYMRRAAARRVQVSS